MANDFTARVAGISVELGMSVQNKSGIWCKPTVKMDIKIDGGTNPQQREAIIKQAFDEVCDNIEENHLRDGVILTGGGGRSISPLSLTGGNYGKTDKSKRG